MRMRPGSGHAIGGPDARLTAALTVAAYRAVHVTTAGRLLSGERAADVAEDHRVGVNAAFDALERALSPVH
ncbi:hypothetical protein PV721_01285 [Streptomyces sp. MB09-01]|uniref:hypothetical protein n=1 Tax=Streptomyces sp. MB09-01 TaxID=3028666 RepID=UPI0029B1E115|nr:hypothetical protein [Streptomyces sp. MB09-01]MDX3533025.1 hypothetical protein [Streptomyces sp. MB09-01]